MTPWVIKGNIFFDGSDHGWTETLYWVQPGGDLTSAVNSLETIVQKRAPLLGTECAVIGWRTSYLSDGSGNPVLGDAALRQRTYAGTATQPADEPDASLLCRFETILGNNHRNCFLRGIWDSVDVGNGGYDPSVGTWASLIQSWKQAMLQRGVGWVVDVKAPRKRVTNYVIDPDDNNITFTCEAGTFGAGPYKNQKVRFQGLNAPDKSVLNGLQMVTPLSDTTCKLVKPRAAFPFTNEGTISTYTQVFVTAAQILDNKIVTRKVGSPLLVSRGRARASARG